MSWIHVWRNVRTAIRLRGGVMAVLHSALAVVRREGWGGMRRLFARAGVKNDYASWIARFDSLDDEKRAHLAAQLAQLTNTPLISVVVPVYNTPRTHLVEMIRSVQNQIYPVWELCICDDASTLPETRTTLAEFAAADARIKVAYRSENGHICASSNDALALASGAWMALLDHDDLLAEHALLMVASYINRHADARMFYSDEDKLAPDYIRIEPNFKPDWNAVLMLGQNAFSHLGVIDTQLVRDVGGFRPGLEGSQDHDLVLRCAEHVSSTQIVHIPHVLYHWRISAGSTSRSVDAKPYAQAAAQRAVAEHLQRTGQRAHVEPVSSATTMLRLTYALPSPPPLVSIIIPTRDQPDLLRRCLTSLFDVTRYPSYEVIIVDNGTTDPKAREILTHYAGFDNVRVLPMDMPFNFAALNNAAVATAAGSVLCLMNNDIETILPDWLDLLVGYAVQPWAGAVGAALWYPDDRLQHGGVVLSPETIAGHMHHLLHRGDPGYFGRAMLAQEVSAVTAACFVVRTSLYLQACGMNEELAVAYNDIDFCLRLKEIGARNVFVPYASAYHHESASRGTDVAPEKAARLAREAEWMRARWHSELSCDKAYNPNLATANGEFFTLAIPPRQTQFQ